MTYLVGILGGDKIFKIVFSSALIPVILGFLFFGNVQNAFAQPTINPDGSISRPTLPWLTPTPPPVSTRPTPPGTVDPITGAPEPGGGTGGTGGTGAVATDGVVGQDTVVENVAETPVGQIDNMALRFLHAVFVEGLGWVLGVFGYFFDFAIEHFIIGFGEKYLFSNLGDTIEALWSTVRDIFNLTFIFGLVYIGFKMILDSSDSSARRMLVYLIGAALLVNFSLFITKFVIDLSNLTAYQIYRAFAGDSAVGGFSLTSAFKDLMGVNSILGVKYDTNDWIGFRYIFGVAIVFLVMSYVFLAGAIMITIRFVVLCIYMVFSPLMFLGWVFPAMQGQSAKYWKGFLSQAFFAPAFLFMIYLSYRVAFSYGETRRSWEHVFNNGSAAAAETAPDTIAYFALVMVFLVASLMIARHMGAYGATVAIATGNKLWKGSARGLGGLGGKFTRDRLDKWATNENAPIRRSVGRAATLLGARDFAEKAYKNSPQGTWSETRKKRSGELATRQAQTSLDQTISRGVTAVTGSQEQINFERAIQGANQSQLVESLREQGQGSEGYNRIVRAMSGEQVRDLLKVKDDVFKPNERRDLSVASGAQAAVRLQAALTPGGPARTLSATVPRASVDDLYALSKVPDPTNPNTNLLAVNAQHISAARMDDLRSKLAPTEFSNLNTTRNNQLLASFNTNPATVFNNRSDVEIARLPREILTARTSAGVLVAENHLNINALRLMTQGNNNGDYVLPNDRQTIKTALENTPNTTVELTRIVDWLATPQGQAF